METSQRTSRLRASTLWAPGVLAVILGVSIHTHVGALREQARVNAENPVVYILPVDLNEPSVQETGFMPAASRSYVVRFAFRTVPGSPAANEGIGADTIVPLMQTAAFEVAWKLSTAGQDDVCGSITERDLRGGVQTDNIRHLFGGREVPLKGGRSYTLAAEVRGPSSVLNHLAPALVVETTSSLKGHPLAGWRLRDTGLLVFLGASLISLGLSKRFSDRKRRRHARAPAAASAAGQDI